MVKSWRINKQKKIVVPLQGLKKVFTILLLVSFLFSNTELHQLCGLPALFQHFMEHKKSEHKISLVDFLKKHYTERNNNKTSGNNDEHKHLPFKSHDCGAVHSSVNFMEPAVLNFTYQNYIFNQEKITCSDFFHTSVFLSNIWQPPKTA
jgi:hypothetical protein